MIRMSPQQRKALQFLADGGNLKDARDQIGIAPATLKQHLQMAKLKLGTRHRAHTIAAALREGLIE